MTTIENQLVAAGGRLLKPPYMMRAPRTPLLPFALESIGDDLRMRRKFENARLNFREMRFASADFAPFVRRIIGVDQYGQLRWATVRGNRSYAQANSRGSRGVFYHYILERGPIYEINEPKTWGKVDRYFVRFIGTEQCRLTISEVLECLEN